MLVTINTRPVFALYHVCATSSTREGQDRMTEIFHTDLVNEGNNAAYEVACAIAAAMTEFGQLRALVSVPYPEHPDAGTFAVFPPGRWPRVETSNGGGHEPVFG